MADQPQAEPLRRHEAHKYLHVPHYWLSGKIVRPWGLNPTQMEMHDPHANAGIVWSSRPHRKHRYAYVHNHGAAQPKRPFYRLWAFDFKNISWWIAQLFLWGSVAWVINGWFLFLPTSHENLNFYMAGISAVVGGTLFWIGAYLSVVEAVNADPKVRTPYQLLHMGDPDLEAAGHNGKPANGKSANAGAGQPPQDAALHVPQQNGSGEGGRASSSDSGELQLKSGSAFEVEQPAGVAAPKQRYKWWGWRWHDIGYIAVFVQFIGATLFQVSVITGCPKVLPEESMTNWWTWDACFWALQIVGAWGFIISAIVFMLECQDTWWKPAPLRIGWQVGFWNLIGGLGFEASPIGGVLAFPGMVPQRWITDFSTFWGGWAFLIGSYLQLLECINKHPTSMGMSNPKPISG